MDDIGAISLVPTLIVFVLAILTRRPIESLLAGSLVGLGMINGMQFVAGFAEASIRVMTDEDVAWVILVCGFMGGCVACSCCYLRIHPVAGQHETCRVARTNHRPDRAAWCPAYRTGKQYDRTEKRCQATNFNVYPADDRAGGGDAVRQHVWQPRLFLCRCHRAHGTSNGLYAHARCVDTNFLCVNSRFYFTIGLFADRLWVIVHS